MSDDSELLDGLSPGELLKLKRGGRVEGLNLQDTLFSRALLKYTDRKIAARTAWPDVAEQTQTQRAGRALKKSAVHAYLRRELVNEKKVLPKVARALDEALDAHKSTKSGLVADHLVRLQAVDRVVDVLGLEVPDEAEPIDVSGFNSAELEWIVEHGGVLPNVEQRAEINAIEGELVTDEKDVDKESNL